MRFVIVVKFAIQDLTCAYLIHQFGFLATTGRSEPASVVRALLGGVQKMTTSKDIVEAFKGIYCQHKPDEHGEGRARLLNAQAFILNLCVSWSLRPLTRPLGKS